MESNLQILSSNETSVIELVNTLIETSIEKSASDLHFEPYENYFRVRIRIDGILHEVHKFSSELAHRITSRIKVMGELDISERRIPQDGRFKFVIKEDRKVDCRVNTCPTLFGEKIAIRFLESRKNLLNLELLGMETFQKNIFLNAIEKPQGLILITGPTGSGKSLTLYSALDYLNATHRNILTVENPVEIQITGINQVNINVKSGLTFTTVLRSFLRQDPDIIMVGEIRDFETAEISIKASQTGHLIFSTLHTNNAVESITRLISLGINTYDLIDSLSLIISQRLIRKLCDECKQPVEQQVTEFKQPIYKAIECKQCLLGYKGRTGVFEILEFNEPIKNIFLNDRHTTHIQKIAEMQGLLTLKQMAYLKVQQGITSLEEIKRVIKE